MILKKFHSLQIQKNIFILRNFFVPKYANASTWKTEITKMREFLNKYANVPSDDILGARAPSLKLGFNVSSSPNFLLKTSLVQV